MTCDRLWKRSEVIVPMAKIGWFVYRTEVKAVLSYE